MRVRTCDIPRMADLAYDAACKRSTIVWWEIPRGEFELVEAEGRLGQALLSRFDILSGLVGVFDASGAKPCSLVEIEDALRHHADGRLAA